MPGSAGTSITAIFAKLFGVLPKRWLAYLGIKLAVAASVSVLLSAALLTVVAYTQALPVKMLNFLLLAGFGQYLTIVGGALLVRAQMGAGNISVVKK